MTPADFAAAANVSRETLDRLRAFADLLAQWQSRINLVSTRSLEDVWRRHVLDSTQLLDLGPPHLGPWVDLGSGAGFPGLVLAILGANDVHLIESDSKKAAFLAEAARKTGVVVTLHKARIEAVAPFPAAVVTARALAPLPRLLDLASPFFGPETIGLFPKGRDVEAELTLPPKYSNIALEKLPSRSDPGGTIVRVRGLHHVGHHPRRQ